MNIDELVDKIIQEEWQSQIKKELDNILPHVKTADEAIGALEQVMGQLTDYQKSYVLELIDKGQDNER